MKMSESRGHQLSLPWQGAGPEGGLENRNHSGFCPRGDYVEIFSRVLGHPQEGHWGRFPRAALCP